MFNLELPRVVGILPLTLLEGSGIAVVDRHFRWGVDLKNKGVCMPRRLRTVRTTDRDCLFSQLSDEARSVLESQLLEEIKEYGYTHVYSIKEWVVQAEATPNIQPRTLYYRYTVLCAMLQEEAGSRI